MNPGKYELLRGPEANPVRLLQALTTHFGETHPEWGEAKINEIASWRIHRMCLYIQSDNFSRANELIQWAGYSLIPMTWSYIEENLELYRGKWKI